MEKIFIQIFDANDSKREVTPEGYLIIKDNIIARTGIQRYKANEVGLNDSNEIINAYRPPEEVFDADSLASYPNKSVTVLHPKEFISVVNHNGLSVGNLFNVRPMVDDGTILGDVMITSLGAIKAINDPVRPLKQLSMGYTSKIEFKDGVTDDGVPYKAVITRIRSNHLALVPKGRAGNAELNDHDTILIFDEGADMPNKTGQLAPTTEATEVVTVKTQLTDEEFKSAVAVEAKKLADAMIAENNARNEIIGRAKILVKDYSPNAEADRRQVILDCMNTAGANAKVKSILDAMFNKADPSTLNDAALMTGFNFITNIMRDLPYLVTDAATEEPRGVNQVSDAAAFSVKSDAGKYNLHELQMSQYLGGNK